MRELKIRYPQSRFIGIGGPLMEKEGLTHSLFNMDDLSIIGFLENLPKVIRVLKHLKKTQKTILLKKPDIAISIDAPDFYLRLAKAVKKQNPDLPWIHYNSPAVWASRPKRAARIARFLDHLLCILPFEPPYFTKHGLKATFVGHPLTEESAEENSPPLNLPKSPDILAITLLFGSRSHEVKMLSSPFIDACILLYKMHPTLHLLIPTFDKYKDFLETKLKSSGIPYTFIHPDHKHTALKSSKAAIVASGTVTLEVARAQTPFVVGYKLAWLTYQIVKRIITTPYVCLINILLKKRVVAECLQHDCNAQTLAHEVEKLLTLPSSKKDKLQQDLMRAFLSLKHPTKNSVQAVVDVVEEYLPLG